MLPYNKTVRRFLSAWKSPSGRLSSLLSAASSSSNACKAGHYSDIHIQRSLL